MKNVVNLPIENITPFTLLDFPDKTACILWFAGCNMKCRFCYNPEIVYSNGKINYEEVLTFLNKRIGLLDGVVFSGGECTTQKGFVEFVKQVKDLGFAIKIDTNGSTPWVLEELINSKYLDYVALDFKAIPDKFKYVTQSKLFNRFEKSLDLLLEKQVNFEVRTTYHEKLLTINDLRWMGKFLVAKNYGKTYFIQHFINDTNTIEELGSSFNRISKEYLSIENLAVCIRN